MNNLDIEFSNESSSDKKFQDYQKLFGNQYFKQIIVITLGRKTVLKNPEDPTVP